jgi:hypothetical protein
MRTDAVITPENLRSGDSITIKVRGAMEFAGRAVSIELWAADSIEIFWIATVPSKLDSKGDVDQPFDGVQVARETAIWVNALIGKHSSHRFELVEPSIVDSSALSMPERSSESMARIAKERLERYDHAIGDRQSPNAREHRLTYAMDNVLLTTQMHLPGVTIRPIDSVPSGSEERRLLERAIELAGWHTTVPEDRWSQEFGHQHPWLAITFPKVWAVDYLEAELLTRQVRDRILGLLALSRGSHGRSVGVVIETREANDQVSSKIRLELPRYRGNLAGGEFAGESQSALLIQAAALQTDPLLQLCVDLFAEAIAETAPDAKYFRLWSVLETLAKSRVAGGMRVALPDGSFWENGATTDRAAPRVYEFINSKMMGIDVSSVVHPAPDLHTAVRAWYGRRNATAHSGKFNRSDPGNASPSTFAYTVLTPDAEYGVKDPWLDAMARTVQTVLQKEAHAIGEDLI